MRRTGVTFKTWAIVGTLAVALSFAAHLGRATQASEVASAPEMASSADEGGWLWSGSEEGSEGYSWSARNGEAEPDAEIATQTDYSWSHPQASDGR